MLRIIISPAKKMNVMDDYPVDCTTPRFLEKTEVLKTYLQGQDYPTLKEIWKCNDKIASLNYNRLRDMDLYRRLTPAVFAYEGIQYQSMAPGVFERSALDYIGEHLYILSGFYGILRAFDGVVPYRLEMQAKIMSNLYDFWGDDLYQTLVEIDDEKKNNRGQSDKEITILNLASKEYSKAIEPWVEENVRFVTCVFGELQDTADGSPKIKVKATAAKMARGAMVRYMAEHQIEDVGRIKEFDWMGYHYSEEHSEEDTFVFLV